MGYPRPRPSVLTAAVLALVVPVAITADVAAESMTGACGDVAQFLGDAAHAGATDGPGPGGSPSVLWTYPTAMSMPGAPSIVGGVAYVADGLMGAGALRALDPATGLELWHVELPGQPFGSTPAVSDGIAYVGDIGGSLTAVDTAGRSVVWTVTLATAISSSPAVADGTVFVNADDVLHALDPSTGTTRWSFDNGGDGGYTIESSPAVADGLVYVTAWSSAADESMWALDVVTGEEVWSYAPETPGLNTPAVAGGVVFAGGAGGLVALDAVSGDELWTSPIGDVYSPPAVSDGMVIVQTSRDMVAVDAATGAERWRADTGGSWSAPALAGGVVYVGSNGMAFQQSLQIVDAATGTPLGLVPGLGSANAAVVVTGGVAYVGSDVGLVAVGTPGANGCAAPAG